ncbi:MAG TPA: S26 family signal peptidase [Candidatus Thermoplasmatota archaeon]|nr:S26 family signal peptidase [Candidatus Thermoplasmatota archaeon]
MSRVAWLRERAPRLHRFLTRDDSPYPAVREVLAGAFVILALLGVLYAATGQPIAGGYPVVVVTSGSMMHCADVGLDGVGPSYGKDCKPLRYGRIGTIDPGDLVFVRHITDRAQVATLAQAGATHYAKAGDVVVYRPGGSTQVTPIIHRALFYVQVNDSDHTYSVPDLGIFHVATLDQKAVTSLTHCTLGGTTGPHRWTMADSGFITKGDNNQVADQCANGLATGPARLDWVLGKARGELPWFGLIKLFVDDLRGPSTNFSNAGGDTKVMLVVSLGVLVALPYGVTAARKLAGKGKDEGLEPLQPPPQQ